MRKMLSFASTPLQWSSSPDSLLGRHALTFGAPVDVRLSRALRLGERWSLQTMIESFTTLNRANWAVPENVIGNGAGEPSPGVGRPTAGFDPRQFQLGLRLGF